MEVTDCTKIVLDKIQSIEPENATKIIGYLLLNHTHQEIMEYAFGSDHQILSLINEAKAYLTSSPKPIIPCPIQPDQSPVCLSPQTISRQFSSPSSFRVPAPYLAPHSPTDLLPRAFQMQAELAGLEEQLHTVNSPLCPDYPRNHFYSDAQLGGGLGPRGGLILPTGLPEFSNKACHYFYKGYCRHGSYCKFFHGQAEPDSLSQIYGPNVNDFLSDEHVISPASLERLELEISEILKARKGMPVSIASLPLLYLEKYGKTLQAEGYLTESQRHGKAGFSLTKLLARLTSIRLIDRPHGQHAVVLAEEEAAKFEYRSEISDSAGAALSSSHQIYLTFPAESTFTDEDVLNYFKQFGPVRDVRIPRQEKRMFGFVSFYYPETVRIILSKGYPHHICGSRVLVKPYKEKARMHDRRYAERAEFPMYYPLFFEMEPEPHPIPRVFETSLTKKQLMEEQEHALELESLRLLALQLTPKQRAPHFNFERDQNNGSTSDDKHQPTANSSSDQDSGHIELPDSPFASPRLGNNVYTVV